MITDDKMETHVPGLYVVGDVRSQYVRQISNAVGDATTAAVAATRYIEELDADRRAPTRPKRSSDCSSTPVRLSSRSIEYVTVAHLERRAARCGAWRCRPASAGTRWSTSTASLHAVDNNCPHNGGPLSKGTLIGRELICPWHAWRWDVTSGRNCCARHGLARAARAGARAGRAATSSCR